MTKTYTTHDGTKLTQNEYLYLGCTPPLIPQSIIDERVERLKVVLNILMGVHYMQRDTIRVNKVREGISFWRNINNN